MAASVADQGVAALTNIAVVVFVARQSTASDFAGFAVVYAVFTVLLGAFTAFVGQALVLRRGPAEAVHAHCRAAALFTLLGSAATGVVLAGVGLALPAGGIAAGLGALALVLPVVLTQDALRYAFSVLGLPQRALAADVLRLAAVVPALAAQPYGTGPGRMVTVWGLSAVPALLLGTALLLRATRGAPEGGPPPVRGRARDLLRRGHLGRRFVVEFGVGNAATQLAIVALGLLASPLVVGALRGAGTLFGPMNVLFNAVTGFGPPLLGRLTAPVRQARAAAVTGGLLAAAAGLWALTLMLLPDAAGRALLGDTWQSAAALLPATGSQYAAMALGVCALVTLRVLRPRTTLRIQVVFSLLSVCFLLGGYALGGVLGAAWGLCAGSACKAAAGWLRARAVLREHASGVEEGSDGQGRGGGDGGR